MKKARVLFFAAVMVCILIACADPLSDTENTVTIGGTVRVTQNNVPWNEIYFPSGRYNVRSVGPNPWRPAVLAFTAPIRNRDYLIGSVRADDIQSESDLIEGTLKWSMKIPADKLPLTVYFGIRCWMGDICDGPVEMMTDGVLINGMDTSIDLGTVDYNVVRLSGNLPVTINGEPLGYDAQLHIRPSDTFIEAETVKIAPNGDWSVTAMQSYSPMPLKFIVEAQKNGGVFRKELNPDYDITVYDTDKEIIFPAYPSVNFEAVTLSGKVKLLAKKTVHWFEVSFYEEEVAAYTAWDLLIGSSGKIQRPEWGLGGITDKDGIVEWSTMVPAFSFPYDLHFWVQATTDGKSYYHTGSNITITTATDLSNIDLGVFTVD
jgi:hypothetical protein